MNAGAFYRLHLDTVEKEEKFEIDHQMRKHREIAALQEIVTSLPERFELAVRQAYGQKHVLVIASPDQLDAIRNLAAERKFQYEGVEYVYGEHFHKFA